MADTAFVTEREALVAAAGAKTQADNTNHTNSRAATNAGGLAGLAKHHLEALLALLRGGANWDQAVTALKAGQDPKLVPSDAVLAANRALIEAAV